MAAKAMLTCLLAVFSSMKTTTMAADQQEILSGTDQKATAQHRTDSLTILMLLGLLLLTVLTVWLFKHRRFRFVHETGLSMIYGLIVGAIIRYTSKTKDFPQYSWARLLNNETYFAENAPEMVRINFTSNATSSLTPLEYRYSGPVLEIDKNLEPPLERTVTFDPEIFFNVMLPVIIFEAGYSMKRKHFFRNLGAILMYALIGTTLSCLVVGGVMFGLTKLMPDLSFNLNDCFLFGAIISATDPVTVLAIFNDLHVDVDLYALVFGESVLNDAVAIVLSQSVLVYGALSTDSFNAEAFFKSFGEFVLVFAGAFAIGGLFGVVTAFLTKFTKVRDFPLLETALFFLMSYCSFQAAEAADLTGIVAVLFCGITQAHYTYNNLSIESKARTKQLFELANFLAENFVFLYIGVSVFTLQTLQWHAGFILSAFLAVILGRFTNIYPLSFLLNLGRSNKIRPNFQHMMMFSGLRGAVAFALAIRDTQTASRQHMASATMMIVLATVILCGGFTTPMLQWLQIRVGVEEDAGGTQLNQMTSVRNQATAGENSLTASTGSRSEKAWLVAKWYNFDTIFMKPLLTNCRPTLMETLPNCCLRFAKLCTTEEQMTQGVGVDQDSDTDMIIDENQLSIGGMSDGGSEQGASSNHETIARREPLQFGDGGVGQFEADDKPLTP